VLSDLAQANQAFWQRHPRFKSWANEGKIDFTHFDLQSEDDITLDLCGQSLEEVAVGSPVIVIANYLFDSVPQDLFHLTNNEFKDTLLGLHNQGLGDIEKSSQPFKSLQLNYDYQLIHTPVYAEAYLNGVLDVSGFSQCRSTSLNPLI
jgi:hypothetical protein